MVYVCVRVSGSTKAWFDVDSGYHTETDNDPIKMSFSDIVRCGNCGKVRNDLVLSDNRVLPNNSFQPTRSACG